MPVSNSWVRILCKGRNWYLTNAVSREILYYHHHFVSFCIVEIMWYLFVRKLIFKKIFSNVIKAICNFKRCYYNLFMEVWDTPWTVTNQIKFRCVPPPLDPPHVLTYLQSDGLMGVSMGDSALPGGLWLQFWCL